MGDVIPPTGPRSSNSLRPCLSLVNEIRRCSRVQGSTVRTQISMAQGEKARGVLDSGFFRQPVVRSGDAVHRPAAPPRRTCAYRKLHSAFDQPNGPKIKSEPVLGMAVSA